MSSCGCYMDALGGSHLHCGVFGYPRGPTLGVEGCRSPSLDYFLLRLILDPHKWYQILDLASLRE